MELNTQLGGSYRPGNHWLFPVKQKLEAAGVRVTHPMSDEFIRDSGGRTYTFDPAVWSVHEVELDYYRSIATCDFHVVCNGVRGANGLILPGTARAIMYAMLKGKPIILLHPPRLDLSVDTFTRDLLTTHLHTFHVHDLIHAEPAEIHRHLLEITRNSPQYQLEKMHKTTIQERVGAHLQAIIQPV